MWELDYKESLVQKNWCFWTVVLEKTLESLLRCKEIQPVNPKGDQPWTFIGRTNAKAEIPILWPPDANSWLIGKDPDAGKDQGQEEKGTTEDEIVGWHHWLDGHAFEQALGVDDGQESLHAAVQGVMKGQTRLGDWSELNWTPVLRINLCPSFLRHSVYQILSLESVSHFHCMVVRDVI